MRTGHHSQRQIAPVKNTGGEQVDLECLISIAFKEHRVTFHTPLGEHYQREGG